MGRATDRASYVEELSSALVRVLDHASGLKPHRLAGYMANLDFWMSEARHRLDLIDGYPRRFMRMREGTDAHMDAHPQDRPVPFFKLGGLAYEDAEVPQDVDTSTTRSLQHAELRRVRAEVLRAARRFVGRARACDLVNEARAQGLLDDLR